MLVSILQSSSRDRVLDVHTANVLLCLPLLTHLKWRQMRFLQSLLIYTWDCNLLPVQRHLPQSNLTGYNIAQDKITYFWHFQRRLLAIEAEKEIKKPLAKEAVQPVLAGGWLSRYIAVRGMSLRQVTSLGSNMAWHWNRTACSESNTVQSSRSKSTTCPRKGRLLRFESNSTATSDGGAQQLGNDVWHDSMTNHP